MCYKLQPLTLSDVRKEFLSHSCFDDVFATIKFFVQMAENRDFESFYYCRFLFYGGNAVTLAETLWSILGAYNVVSVKVSVIIPDSGCVSYSNTFLSGHGLASGCN